MIYQKDVRLPTRRSRSLGLSGGARRSQGPSGVYSTKARKNQIEKFAKGDININDIKYRKYRQMLVDIFIDCIYLYDNLLQIYEGQINIPLDEPVEGSPKGHVVEHMGIEPMTS